MINNSNSGGCAGYQEVVAIRVDWWASENKEVYAEYKVGSAPYSVHVDQDGHESIKQKAGNQNSDNAIVTKIDYHESRGEADRHYADVTFTNGIRSREFNVNSVIFYAGKDIDG